MRSLTSAAVAVRRKMRVMPRCTSGSFPSDIKRDANKPSWPRFWWCRLKAPVCPLSQPLHENVRASPMETPTLLIECMISVTASNLALMSAWSSSEWVTCENKEKSCQTTYSTWYHNKFSSFTRLINSLFFHWSLFTTTPEFIKI